jgi:signal transduction histidine kinase
MDSTISQAKLFSQIQEGKAGGEFRKIDLKETIQGCIEMLYPKAEKFNIRFKAGEGSFELMGTPLIEQAILNILDNSMKYSPLGSEISIRIDTNIEGVVLSISDEGPGISDDIKNEVFRRFWRGEKSMINAGTGLGLAITKGIVEMHQGKIWIEDGESAGSVFKIYLPWDPSVRE